MIQRLTLTGFLYLATGTLFIFAQSRRDTFLKVADFAIHFDYNSAQLTDSAVGRIDHMLDSLSKFKDKIFILSAHTSQSGSTAYNQRLSEKRLEEVRRVLIDKGIDSTHVEGLAYGKERPLVKGKNEENQAVNRRVEIEVRRRFMLTTLQGRIQKDSGEMLSQVWVRGSNRFFRDSVLAMTNGDFSMAVPDFMPLTLSTFVPGYAVDVVNTMVDSKKNQTTATIPLIPLRAGQAIYFHSIQFYGNKNIVLPKSMEALENLGIQLIRNRDYCFEIQGHVNAPGVPASQVMTYMDLSKARAGRVYEWLKQKGMDAQRMLAAGYGHLKMLYPNAREEQLQEKNRRVEIHIIDCKEMTTRRQDFNEAEFLRLSALPLYSDFRVNAEQQR